MLNRISMALAAIVLVALPACSSDTVPAHEHPEYAPQPPPPDKYAARIESFSVTPAIIKPGESATLSWSVADTKSIVIKDADGTPIPGVEAAAAKGSVTVSPTVTTSYLLAAEGEGGQDFAIVEVRIAKDPVVIPDPPLLIAAVPEEIDAGQTTHLVWNAPGPVVIANADGFPVNTGGRQSGSVALTDLVTTTTFTARSGTHEKSVTIKVTPAIAAFVANPAGAAAGQPVELSWRTYGATDLTISETSRGLLHTAAANERNEGRFVDTIPADLKNGTVLNYRLTAKAGAVEKTAEILFVVSAVPTSVNFNLANPVLTRNGSRKPSLSWTTTGAARLKIYSGSVGGAATTLIYSAPSDKISSGSVELPLPDESTDFELVAEAAQGGQTTKRVTLKIVDPPAFTHFAPNPTTVAAGGDATQLEWTTTSGARLDIVYKGAVIFRTRSVGAIANGSMQVNPGQTSEYEAILFNEAGDSVTQKVTVDVAAPLSFTLTPQVAVPGETITMSWDFTGTGVNVVGAPADIERVGSDSFRELSTSTTATRITALNTTSTSALTSTLTFPDGFIFRHYGVPYTAADITSHGWLGFGSQSSGTRPLNVRDTATPNNFIAPYAETLKNCQVYWEMQGAAPNRELVIQWEKCQSGNTGSEYSFETVLGEDGHIDFLYKTITHGTGTTAFEPRIGIENQTGSGGVRAGWYRPATSPQANEHVVFSGFGPVSGSTTFSAVDSGTFQLRVNLAAGGSTYVAQELLVLKPGNIGISEVMYKPVAGALGAKGQWVEIVNRTSLTIDSGDLSVRVGSNTWPLPAGTPIEPGAYIVVGQSANLAENGETPVSVVVPELALPAAGSVSVLFHSGPNSLMETVSYDDAVTTVPEGASIVSGDGTYRMVAGPGYCASTVAYGNSGSMGSPGIAGATKCGLFTFTMLPTSSFQSLENNGGTKLVEVTSTSTTSLRLLRKLTFPAGFEFPFDGQMFTEAFVSMAGYMSLDPTLTESDSDPNQDNPATYPNASAPKGLIAPFWDEIWSVTASKPRPAIYTKLVDPDNNPGTLDGYLIVQWVHWPQYWGSNSNPADFNFEVRLFQTGDIEFHYGEFIRGDISNDNMDEYRGADATVAIGDMNNVGANVYSHFEEKISPHTAIRWTKN